MKSRFRALAGAFLFCAALAPALRADSPHIITFQGVLMNAAGIPKPAGTYPNVSFRLYDHLTGPTQLWLETKTITVAGGHGVFATVLGDTTALPPSVSFGLPYWISVQVGADAEMTPRIPLASVPYALNAWGTGGNAGTISGTQFLGTTDSQPLVLKANGHRVLQLQDAANTTVHSANVLLGSEANSIAAGVVGSTIGGGGQATGINDLRGDFGVVGGGAGNFLDAFPYAVIGGGAGNIAQGGYSTISGGNGNNSQADYSVIAGGSGNYAGGKWAVVAGGNGNTASGLDAFVGGGNQNQATGEASSASGLRNTASGNYSSVGGGLSNLSAGDSAVVGGGVGNIVYGSSSVLGGGEYNVISTPPGIAANDETISGGGKNQAYGFYATIGGGYSNIIGDASAVTAPLAATVGGGKLNFIGGDFGTVSGGEGNWANNLAATVPGGYNNSAAGEYSFAAGYKAGAGPGCFVWSDKSVDSNFNSQAANEFCVRAAGGIVLETGQSVPLYTGIAGAELNRYLQLLNSPNHVSASGLKAGGILCADDYGFANPDKNSLVVKGPVAIGTASPGGRALYVNGLAGGTSDWNSTSDARLKTNVSTLGGALDIVESLRGVTFDWRPDTGLRLPEGRQIGFVAQEVEKVLPSVVFTDDKGYKSVAYAKVVPILVEAVKTQQQEIAAKDERIAALEDRMERMERLLETRR